MQQIGTPFRTLIQPHDLGHAHLFRIAIHSFNCVAALHFHAQAAVPSRGIHLQPALGSTHPKMALMKIAVTRGAVRQDSTGKAQLKIDVLFHLFEARIARSGVHHGVHLSGFFAREIARGIQSVDADIH